MRRTRILTAVLTLAAGLPAGAPPALATSAPEVALAADTYTWKNARIDGGGFVPGIVFNRSEKNLAYARTDIGGAYRWQESTKTWTPLLDSVGWDEWGHTGVVSLASDSLDPNKVYAAVGTYTNSWDPTNGAVLRSSDRGAGWQKADLPFKLGGNMPGRGMGERLAIDPNKDSVLYLGAPSGKGLWRSTDSGATWSQVGNFPNVGNYVQDPSDTSGYASDNQGIVWVTFDESTGTSGTATRTIYVGVADKDNAVYRSTDAGATWTRLAGQPTGYLAHKGVLDAKNGYLYLAYSDKGGPYDGGKGRLWRYATASGTWTDISPVAEADTHYGFSGLTVDRQHPGTVMTTAYSSWWPDTQIFRSTDSGGTWTKAWDYTSYPNRSNRYTMDVSSSPWLTFDANPSPPEQAPKLGWMTESLEIDPFNSDRMMYGTGATLYRTEDLTQWDSGGRFTVKPRVQGLEETAVNDLASPPSGGAQLFSALGDIGGFRHTDLTKVPSMMFTSPTFTTTTSLDFAEADPNTVVRVGDLDSGPHIAFSTDNGANWFAGTDPSGVSGGGTVAAASDGRRFVWSPAGTGVQYTTGFGSSWAASSGIPSGATVESDRVDPKTFYGFKSGKFYVSSDGGATFSASSATGLPSGGSVRFKALPGVEGDVWLAGGASDGAYVLWHSTDGGASFSKLSGVEQADTIGFGKAATGASYQTLYTSAKIGGVRGIFRSTDKGATWTRVNDDAHQWGWTGGAITGDPRVYGRVYVSTNGRGVMYGDTSDTSGGGDNGGGGTDPTPTGACTVTYKITNQWSGGFQADVQLTNTGASAWSGWSLGWTFADGQKITQLWNADHTQSGAAVTAKNVSWNGTVAANSSVGFGFTGSWSGANTKPTSFKLGDQTCTVA
ncbi:cellulose binding domain-containing protein [Streptomyces sp. NRRL S-646]|uniref:cellulose binding domain-containing protein n=1 Tax=Streptomyces sp. NRRL S-646 TaxID=1463917 RepID=UPI0004C9B07A|nr:cellulose binding domain-containing protein [Streptomyces sp. NRRL S-646]